MPIEIGLLSSQQDSFEHHEELNKLLTETDVFYVPLRNEFNNDSALHSNEDLTDLTKRFDEDLSKKHLIVTFRDIGYSLFLERVESLPDAHDRSKIRISGKMIVDGICIKFYGCFDYGHQTQQINGVGRIALDEGYYRELSSIQVSETDIKDDEEKSVVNEPVIFSKARQQTVKSKARTDSKTRSSLSISLPSETVQITTSLPNSRTHIHSPSHMPYPLKSPRLKQQQQQISSPTIKTFVTSKDVFHPSSLESSQTRRLQMGSHTPSFSSSFIGSTTMPIPIPSTPNPTLLPGSLPQSPNLFSLPTSHSLPTYIFPGANIAYIPTSTNLSGAPFDFTSLNSNTSLLLITNPSQQPVHILTSIDQLPLQFTHCFPTNPFSSPSSVMPSRTCNILPSDSFAALQNKRHETLEEDKQLPQPQPQSESNKEAAEHLPLKKRRYTGQQSRMATVHDGDGEVSDESLKK